LGKFAKKSNIQMNIEERIRSFSFLGELLREFSSGGKIPGLPGMAVRIDETLSRAEAENPWFTRDNLAYALRACGELLTMQNLTEWLRAYPGIEIRENPKRVGVVMAGNIPLAGFHDFLCVLLSGHHIVARLSKQDARLLPLFGELLSGHDSRWNDRMTFTAGQLSGFDAVIATGSNNTSRYFDYYFGRYPHIIRKNRTSVAVLDGRESNEELRALGSDLFLYFGLGCRNVSKLFLPEGYDLSRLEEPFSRWSHLADHHKFRNNYEYHRSVFLMNTVPYADGGFFLLREEDSLASPVAVVYFEQYRNHDQVLRKLDESAHLLQCVVANIPGDRRYIAPGRTQQPALVDYADGVDTMRFLIEKI
jgi:hypothetical protein